MKQDEVVEKWDVKKISIGLVILLLLVGGIAYMAKIKGWNPKTYILSQTQQVKGAHVQAPFSFPGNSQVAQEFQAIQQQVRHLGVQDIASSSPQVQKVIHDLQELQKYPQNQAKALCQNICSSL